MSWFLIATITLLSIGCNKKPVEEPKPEIKHHKIIPLPEKVTLSGQVKTITGSSTIYIDSHFQRAGEVIIKAIRDAGGLIVKENNGDPENSDIRLVSDEQLDSNEYKMDVDDKKIVITAESPRSAFYAAQTFRQILWNADVDQANGTIKVQAINIIDKPQNRYRGFHMDLSRHFFPKEFVYEIIDMMALYKLNKLQLHLSDDQGWRIMIDKYPDLTRVGAYREFDENDEACMEKAKYDPDYNFDPQFINGNIYGGFYTKQDIRDIVSYASGNFIDVIPEIDMPGHMSAAIRAYPELSCSGDTNWGQEFSEPLCVCKPEVMQFVHDIWDEVIDLFPSNTVHLGADEVDKSFWGVSDTCKQFMEDHSLNNVNKIQSYFVEDMYKYFSSKGKKMIAWDDILVNNDDDIVNQVDPHILVMYWRDYKPESAVYAARNGNSIILTPWSWFYLSSQPTDENLKSLYDFDEKTELDPEVVEKKIGYQACVWTEDIPSEAVFERHIFPRFQAYAEVAWSNTKAWESFTKRMDAHLDFLKRNGIKYTKSKYFF